MYKLIPNGTKHCVIIYTKSMVNPLFSSYCNFIVITKEPALENFK